MDTGVLRFAHVGYGYVICANRVVAVFPPRAEPTKRMMRFAKTNGTYLDMTRGNETKSYLLLEDGTMAAVAFNPMTIYKRLNEDPSERTKRTIKAKVYEEEEIDDDNIDEAEDIPEEKTDEEIA